MEKEKLDQVEIALADFIIRVAKGETTSETEVKVLPEVALALKDYYFFASALTNSMTIEKLKEIEKEYNTKSVNSISYPKLEDLPKHTMEIL